MRRSEITRRLKKPLLVKENRVRRLYRGGALIDRFRGSAEEMDGFLPEDWIGSSTYAMNRDPVPEEGISKIILEGNRDGSETDSDLEMSIQDILSVPEYASALFGDGVEKRNTPGILVKLLDSCTTLSLQTHPDREFTHRHFGDGHGKCESWIVLGGRQIDGEEPFVYFGFKDGVSRQEFHEAYYNQDVAAMRSSLNKIYVQPGDVFYVEPNIIHAIGPGVFMLEVQEPTDYVFQFDRKGVYWDLTDHEMHMGLGDEVMLASMNFELKGEELLNRNMSHVELFTNHEQIIPILAEEQSRYFGCESMTSVHVLQRNHHEIRIGVVIEGCLDITLHGDSLSLEKGDTYILPGSSAQDGNCECIYTAIGDRCENGFFSVLEAFPS